MTTPQTTLNPDQYKQLLDRITRDTGIDETLASALNIHDRRGMIQYQIAKNYPVLSSLLNKQRDLAKILRDAGYKPGYTNKSGTVNYWIKSENEQHKRLSIKRVPKRQTNPPEMGESGRAMRRISKQIMAIVTQSGRSQTKFASLIGVPQSTLSDIKNGRENYKINTIESIVDKMGYRILGLNLEKK